MIFDVLHGMQPVRPWCENRPPEKVFDDVGRKNMRQFVAAVSAAALLLAVAVYFTWPYSLLWLSAAVVVGVVSWACWEELVSWSKKMDWRLVKATAVCLAVVPVIVLLLITVLAVASIPHSWIVRGCMACSGFGAIVWGAYFFHSGAKIQDSFLGKLYFLLYILILYICVFVLPAFIRKPQFYRRR